MLWKIHKRMNCIWCETAIDNPLSPDINLEHLIPKSFGGTFRMSNLALACRSCNTKRGNDYDDETQKHIENWKKNNPLQDWPKKEVIATYIADMMSAADITETFTPTGETMNEELTIDTRMTRAFVELHQATVEALKNGEISFSTGRQIRIEMQGCRSKYLKSQAALSNLEN